MSDESYASRVVALTPLLYAVLRTRSVEADQVEDLVQECLLRLLDLGDRLAPDTLAGYAVVVARNVAATHVRRAERQRRHLPKLVDPRTPPDPSEEALRTEDLVALRQALARLEAHDRELLVDHDIHNVAVGALSRQSGSTPAAVASRLNRTRGRLRVDYVVALHRTPLPSKRCHPVLVALSTADHRRQTVLDASGHLAECSTCAALSPPLVQRQRGALLLLPAAALLAGSRRIAHWLRHHPGHAAAGTALTGAVAVTVALATASTPHPATAAPALNSGYYLVTAKGYVTAYGHAARSQPDLPARLNQRIVAIAATTDGRGFWLASADGGVFSSGDANFYGSAAGLRLNEPVVGMAATPDSHGYWLVTADGTILTFGDARRYDAQEQQPTTAAIVGIAASADGRGYWQVASDGSVRAYGDASFHGDETQARLNRPIVAIAPTPTGNGYWLTAADGGIFAFGDARFYGSHISNPTAGQVTVGMVPTADGRGYWTVTADGQISSFGDAPADGHDPHLPIAAVAEVPPAK